MKLDKVEKSQSIYWKNKLSKNDKQLVEAVGSESDSHKNLRYQKISEIFCEETDFSILDIGAGVGDYYNFLMNNYPDKKIKYTGVEITEDFVKIAKIKYPNIDMETLNVFESKIEHYDFVVLSGIFHQRGSLSKKEWNNFLEKMLITSFKICKKGMAFNLLSNMVDYKREGNSYFDFIKIQQFILKKLSRYFVIDYSYPLFEASFFVYNSKYVKSLNPQSEFKKYIKF